MGDFNTTGATVGQGVAGGAEAAKGVENYQAYSAQGRYQKGISGINSKLLEMQAADTIQRGQIAASRTKTRGGNAAGSQRIAQAKGGVDVNSGSAAGAQSSAKLVSEIDAITLENNAHLAAIGYNMENINQTAKARMAEIASRTNARAAALSGSMGLVQRGINAGQIYDKYKMTVPVDNGTSKWGAWSKGIQPGGSGQSTESQMGMEDNPEAFGTGMGGTNEAEY